MQTCIVRLAVAVLRLFAACDFLESHEVLAVVGSRLRMTDCVRFAPLPGRRSAGGRKPSGSLVLFGLLVWSLWSFATTSSPLTALIQPAALEPAWIEAAKLGGEF